MSSGLLSAPVATPPEPAQAVALAAPGAAWAEVAATGHLALAPVWYGVVRAYGHEPLYLEVEAAGARAVLPAVFLRRRLLGGVVASMPFLDAGGPAGPPHLYPALLARLRLEAARRGAGLLEIRASAPLDLPVAPSEAKVSLALALPPDPDRLWKALDAKVRNQVRKAERAGVTVRTGGAELFEAFYDVFAVNMRDLGSPVHGRGFFRAILAGFGDAARVVVAERQGRPVGGLLALAHGDTLYVPWASTLRREAPSCPNMALYWETLRAGCRAGLARFDFGRSTRGSGTYRFKRQWGAVEVPLYWYVLPLGRGAVQVGGGEERWAAVQQVWRRLPVPLTRLVGPRLRRLLTQ
jgi:FemAB-related protein (PEP-CTERM system-associated)